MAKFLHNACRPCRSQYLHSTPVTPRKEKHPTVFKNYAFTYLHKLHLLWFFWFPQVGPVSQSVICGRCCCSPWLPRFGRLRGRCRCVFPVSFPRGRSVRGFQWPVGAWPRCFCRSFCRVCPCRGCWQGLMGFVPYFPVSSWPCSVVFSVALLFWLRVWVVGFISLCPWVWPALRRVFGVFTCSAGVGFVSSSRFNWVVCLLSGCCPCPVASSVVSVLVSVWAANSRPSFSTIASLQKSR